MTFAINVQGGTGAGRKRPLREKPNGWMCDCREFTVKPGYLVKCDDCGARRP